MRIDETLRRIFHSWVAQHVRTCAALCAAFGLLSPSPSFAVYEHWLRRAWGGREVDGGLCIDNRFGYLRAVATAPDGTIFILGYLGLLRLDPVTGVIDQLEGVDIQGDDLAIGNEGCICVSIAYSHCVKVFSKSGDLLFTIGTEGAEGSAPGQFYVPSGIDTNGNGEIFVADIGNDRIQVFSPDGEFLRQWLAPDWGSRADKIAMSDDGRAFVITSSRHVNVLDSDGTLLGQWGGIGTGAGQFSAPDGIDVDSNGFVYVSDSGRNDVQIFTPDGELVGMIRDHDAIDVAVAPSGLIYVPEGFSSCSRLLEFWYSGTMVRASDPNLEFFVDGERFVGSNLFQWPTNSVHEIATVATQFPASGVRHEFQDWDGDAAISKSIVATDPPSAHTARFQRSYQLTYEMEGAAGTCMPDPGWYAEDAELTLVANPDEPFAVYEWIGQGEGSYTGPKLSPVIRMRSPIVERIIVRKYGVDFTISASNVDPFAVTATPAGGVRNLYLWLTCADRGISAFEADVAGSLEPLAFFPAENVFNVYGADKLLLAIGGCPTGPETNRLLGHWNVEDHGGDFCLMPSADHGRIATVDCHRLEPHLWENPRVFCFSSNGDPQVIGVHGCTDGSAPIMITNFNARPRMRAITLSWEATGGSYLSGFRVEKASGPDGPFFLLNDSPLLYEPPCQYEDREVADQSTYFYRLIALDRAGNEYPSVVVQATTSSWPHMTTRLEPISPNPSAGRAAISFALASPGHAKLAIYDVAGRLVKTVVDGNLDAGSHLAEWKGTDDSGRMNLPGVYFARLETQGFTQTRKILYLRER